MGVTSRIAGRVKGLRLDSLGHVLLRRSALLFGSIALTRILGFGFSVVTARALSPANFGVVTYALALANIASILLYNSPAGLARALARRPEDRDEQNSIISNYLFIIAVLLTASLLVAVPIGMVGRLEALVLVGLLANLLGTAVLETYMELQRGRERFLTMAAFNVLSNLIQLLAVAGFLRAGVDRPGPYVLAFGLSAIVAALLIQPFSPLGIRFVRRTLNRDRLKESLRFVMPLLVDTACFVAWSGADIVLLRAFSRLDVVGEYGAAKSLSNVALLAGSAIGTALLPQAARLLPSQRGTYFRTLLMLVVSLTLPAILVVAFLAPWLLGWFFSPAYRAAAPALALLAVAMGMYGIGLTLEASWIAIGRPRLAAAGTAVAAVVTVFSAPLLIANAGMTGAALATLLGSGGRLALLGVVTVRAMRARHGEEAGGVIGGIRSTDRNPLPALPARGRDARG
jgi:O-antigen/teichoic acid export membrane protein